MSAEQKGERQVGGPKTSSDTCLKSSKRESKRGRKQVNQRQLTLLQASNICLVLFQRTDRSCTLADTMGPVPWYDKSDGTFMICTQKRTQLLR